MDMKFLSYLIEHASSPTICALWNNISSKIHSHLLQQGIIKDSLNIVAQEHWEYLEYIKNQEVNKIEEHLKAHIY